MINAGQFHDKNTTAYLAEAVNSNTYALLSVRDKLDEICQLLRWKFKSDDDGGS